MQRPCHWDGLAATKSYSELEKGSTATDTQLWIELYDHNLQHGLDSYSCTDLEEATIAARELITRARQLNAEVQPDLGKWQNDV